MKKPVKKTPKRGRKPLPAGQSRTKRLDDVRFSPNELAQYRAAAKKSGLIWSAWVRSRLSA